MQFRITYNEIQDLISRKTGKTLPIIYGGPHTVRVSYDVNMLFKSSSVGIDINVDSISGSDIYLSYSGGAAIEMMLKMALGRVKGQPGADMLEIMDGNRLLLALGKNPQTAQFFEKVELRDICFDEQFAIVDFAPKQ